MAEADDNWLEAAVVVCPGCGTQLFAVMHSPFCDNYRLCCDRCPKAIEVSFYDPVCKAAVNLLPAKHTWDEIMAAIEPLLRSCSCGGRFCGDAPRRCYTCGVEVPSAARKDLSPYMGCEDGSRDPTDEEQVAFDRFEAKFLERERLWDAPEAEPL